MAELLGLIPAAGKGQRARPYTSQVPKCLLEINGVPNIVRNLELMRDQLGIRRIVIVVGHLGEQIRAALGDGARFGVQLTYVENRELDRGLAYSVYLAREALTSDFVMLLSDECYIHTNHRALLDAPAEGTIATCGYMRVDDRELIRRNYALELDGTRVTRLTEKPTAVPNDMLGTGTMRLTPAVFAVLERAFAAQRQVDFVTVLGGLCDAGQVRGFELTGTYVNINDRDSLNLAKYHDRTAQFEQARLTLLLYAEGDERQVAFTINRYRRIERLDHIFVVLRADNQIEPLVTGAGAEVLRCPPEVTEYGAMLRHALATAPGDLLIVADADYSHPRRDVLKLLAYVREADMVVGTRTTRQLIEQGTQMRGAVRTANILLAKLLELLWWSFEGRFTDASCNFRAIWKTSFLQVAPDLSADGAGLGAELIVELLRRRERVIEIPVNYVNRTGSSYRKYHRFSTFLSILGTILRKRVQHLLAPATRATATGGAGELP
jgi:dTDP-glucose pyrophosphorylase